VVAKKPEKIIKKTAKTGGVKKTLELFSLFINDYFMFKM
jgi:hypothetical protein